MVAILNRGAFSLGASTIGNTLGDTGVTGSRIVLAGIGGVTLSQITGAAGGTIIISGGGGGGGGAFSAGVSGGNAVGDTGATGTRLVFAGGSNITLSQATDLNGGSVTINAGGGAETQTFLGAIGNSETTYSSGTVRLSELGAVTLRSTTGQAFQISVDPQSVQPETQTFLGGVAASDATYTSGTVSIVGSGIVTVQSGTGQRVIINASQSVQPETQTFIGGIAGSDTTYSSGTVRITGVGGGVTVSSNTGQRIDISVAAPVAQSTQPGVQQFVVSNTTFSSGTVSISGFGAATVNTAANIIRISVPTQTAESQSIGMSNIGNTSGTTGIASGAQVRMLFAGGNNITLSQSLNGASGTLTISAASQTLQTSNVHNVTLSGNTAGVMAQISSGTMTLAGGNNITVSQNGNAVTISGANVGGAQTGISGIANSETTYTSGSVTLSALGAITIRSTTGQHFQLSVNAQSVQPETQTFIAGISASDTLYTSGNVRFTGVGGGITVSSNTGQRVDLSVAAQSVQPGVQHFVVSNTTFSSGTVSISGFGDVTVNTAANIIRISAPTQTAQTGISGIANSQTTYTSGTVSLSELGAITIRSTTGNQFQLSVAAQTAESQSIGMSNIGNTSGTTGIASGAQVRMLFAGGNNVTLSQSLNGASGTLTISAASQSVQPGIQNVVASDATFSSGTVSISGFGDITVNTAANLIRISGPVQTVESQSIGASNLGNTLGTSGVASGGQVRAVIIGTSNITVSQSVNGASATLSLIGQPGFSAGVSNIGNTGGDTGVTATRIVFVGSNNMTLSQTTGANGATIGLNAAGGGAGQFSAGVSTGGNTAGATGLTGTQMVFVGSSPISLSQTTGANGGTITINAPATSSLVGTGAVQVSTNGSTISIGAPVLATLADYQNFPQGFAGLISHIASFSKVPIYFNINMPGVLNINSLAFKVSQVTGNTLQSFSVHLGVYSAVNSTSMSRIGSFSEAYVISSASSASFTGIRNYVMTGVGTHTALSRLSGGDYGIGMMFSAAATQSMNMSLMGASTGSGAVGYIAPGTNSLFAGTSQGVQALWGRGSTTVNALPANVVASELVNQGSGASVQLVPWIYIRS